MQHFAVECNMGDEYNSTIEIPETGGLVHSFRSPDAAMSAGAFALEDAI